MNANQSRFEQAAKAALLVAARELDVSRRILPGAGLDLVESAKRRWYDLGEDLLAGRQFRGALVHLERFVRHARMVQDCAAECGALLGR